MTEEIPTTAAAPELYRSSTPRPPTPLLVRDQIDLRERDDLREAVEPRPVPSELSADGLVVRLRVPLGRCHLDQVNEQPAALDVSEELVAEARPLRRPLDQARNVGEDELPIVEIDRPEVRLHRREWVIRHLRVRPGQPRKQRRLPRVRQADQADVREQLQAQLDLARLALEAALREPRCLSRRGRETLVPVAARPAARDHQPLTVLEQLRLRAVDAQHHRPGRDRNQPVFPSLAVLALALPVLPATRPEMPAAAQRGEVPSLSVADQHDVAAAPAVAAVGPSARDVRLAPADHAVAAASTLDVDLRPIEKHRARS